MSYRLFFSMSCRNSPDLVCFRGIQSTVDNRIAQNPGLLDFDFDDIAGFQEIGGLRVDPTPAGVPVERQRGSTKLLTSRFRAV